MSDRAQEPNPPENACAIRLENLCVMYRVPRERVASITEFAIRWAQRRLEYVDFWALRDVSLQVPRGAIFGVVGPNGAGKTTLLKTVARVLHPTRGRVVVRGQVAPLLDLAAGFHPELTGRENVYLYGALLGYSRRELQESFESIVDFAELWDFIDAPLRTYSTGMTARLGFSVATSRYADVLLVDEVLAVGDARFQARCQDRMRDFRAQGATIVYVTHGLTEAKKVCDQVAWLSEGRLQAVGPAERVIEAYAAG
jgi:ABC-2 type transport system ATP-binding protein/lipopolysaccharide transport system ATP-binding protein